MQPICTHTISVQSAKPSHAYPIIRLPRAFCALAGSKAVIYQTVHDGKLAFLVKILDHPQEKLNMRAPIQIRSLPTADVAGSNPAEPIVLFTIGLEKDGGRRAQ